MATDNDFAKIGDVYGKILNGVKHKLVAEKKEKTKIAPGQIGEVPLIKGGPDQTAGYVSHRIDKKTLKDKTDNSYNIDKLSYDEDEEMKSKHKKKMKKMKNPRFAKKKKTSDKETIKESQKIAQNSLNNFMRKKSIFDKLFENVMTGGNGGPSMGGGMAPGDDMGMDNSEELDALGIEDDVEGEGEDTDVTFTLPRDVAQQLIDVLSAAIGGEDEFGDEFGDDEMDDEFGDDLDDSDDDVFDDNEDEETMGTPGVNAKQPDMGKNNKVGNLKKPSGSASSAHTSKHGPDGDHGHALVNAKQPDMGKNNKVGSLKTGKSMFEQ